VSNGPTEALNNLIKRVKRAAFGFTSFRNYRVRALLYAGKSRWSLLATIRPHISKRRRSGDPEDQLRAATAIT
jgi:hypothetical protein